MATSYDKYLVNINSAPQQEQTPSNIYDKYLAETGTQAPTGGLYFSVPQETTQEQPTQQGNTWLYFRHGLADLFQGHADTQKMYSEAEAANGDAKGAATDLADYNRAKAIADYLRPQEYIQPTSTAGRAYASAIRSTPFSLQSMAQTSPLMFGGAALGSLAGPVGTALGAGLGGIVGSLISGHQESRMEQTDVYRQLVEQQKMAPAEAYAKTNREVYIPNLIVTSLADSIFNLMALGTGAGTFGRKMAEKVVGKEAIGNLVKNLAAKDAKEGIVSNFARNMLGVTKAVDENVAKQLAERTLLQKAWEVGKTGAKFVVPEMTQEGIQTGISANSLGQPASIDDYVTSMAAGGLGALITGGGYRLANSLARTQNAPQSTTAPQTPEITQEQIDREKRKREPQPQPKLEPNKPTDSMPITGEERRLKAIIDSWPTGPGNWVMSPEQESIVNRYNAIQDERLRRQEEILSGKAPAKKTNQEAASGYTYDDINEKLAATEEELGKARSEYDAAETQEAKDSAQSRIANLSAAQRSLNEALESENSKTIAKAMDEANNSLVKGTATGPSAANQSTGNPQLDALYQVRDIMVQTGAKKSTVKELEKQIRAIEQSEENTPPAQSKAQPAPQPAPSVNKQVQPEAPVVTAPQSEQVQTETQPETPEPSVAPAAQSAPATQTEPTQPQQAAPAQPQFITRERELHNVIPQVRRRRSELANRSDNNPRTPEEQREFERLDNAVREYDEKKYKKSLTTMDGYDISGLQSTPQTTIRNTQMDYGDLKSSSFDSLYQSNKANTNFLKAHIGGALVDFRNELKKSMQGKQVKNLEAATDDAINGINDRGALDFQRFRSILEAVDDSYELGKNKEKVLSMRDQILKTASDANITRAFNDVSKLQSAMFDRSDELTPKSKKNMPVYLIRDAKSRAERKATFNNHPKTVYEEEKTAPVEEAAPQEVENVVEPTTDKVAEIPTVTIEGKSNEEKIQLVKDYNRTIQKALARLEAKKAAKVKLTKKESNLKKQLGTSQTHMKNGEYLSAANALGKDVNLNALDLEAREYNGNTQQSAAKPVKGTPKNKSGISGQAEETKRRSKVEDEQIVAKQNKRNEESVKYFVQDKPIKDGDPVLTEKNFNDNHDAFVQDLENAKYQLQQKENVREGDPNVPRAIDAIDTILAADRKGDPADVLRALKDSGLNIQGWHTEDYSDAVGARGNEIASHQHPNVNKGGNRELSDTQVEGEKKDRTEDEEASVVYRAPGGIDESNAREPKQLPLKEEALKELENNPDSVADKRRASTPMVIRENKSEDSVEKKPSPDKLVNEETLKDKEFNKKFRDAMSKLKKRLDGALSGTINKGERNSILNASQDVDDLLTGSDEKVLDTLSKTTFDLDGWYTDYKPKRSKKKVEEKPALTDIMGLVSDIGKRGDKKASVNGLGEEERNSAKFEVNEQNLRDLFGGKLFGKNVKISQNEDGSWTVSLPKGRKVNVTSSGKVQISYDAILRGYGKEMAEKFKNGDVTIMGGYSLKDGIPLIELDKAASTNFTTNHELMHFVAATALDRTQWGTLVNRFAKKDMDIKRQEEAIANAYAAWRENRMNPGSTIKRIFQRIADFCGKIREIVGAKQTAGDIFRSIESGKVYESDAQGIADRIDATGPNGKQYTLLSGPTLESALAVNHATPYQGTIDKFRLDKIGTGEGAQVYGWGLYFAENPEVSKYYKEKFNSEMPGPTISVDGEAIPSKKLNAMSMYHHNAMETALVAVRNSLPKLPKTGATTKVLRDMADSYLFYNAVPGRIISETEALDALNWLDENLDKIGIVRDYSDNRAKVYKVEIPDDTGQYIHWDEDLDKQSEAVKKLVDKYDLKNSNADLLDALDGIKDSYVQTKASLAKVMEYAKTAKNKDWLNPYAIDNFEAINDKIDYFISCTDEIYKKIRNKEYATVDDLAEDFELLAGSGYEDGAGAYIPGVVSIGDSKVPAEIEDAVREYDNATMGTETLLETFPWHYSSDNLSGMEIYHNLSAALGSDRAASEALLKEGIIGNKYLDGSSRRKGEGTYNYVVWDEDSINIMEKLAKAQEKQAMAREKDSDLERVELDPKLPSKLDETIYAGKKGVKGWLAKTGDKIMTHFFDDKWMLGRMFGSDVHHLYEAGTSVAPGKAASFIMDRIAPIVKDISSADREKFETFATWHNLRDIASDRAAYKLQADALRKEIKTLSLDARATHNEYRNKKVIMEGPDIRKYELIAESKLKDALKLRKERSDILKKIANMRTGTGKENTSAAEYDAEIKKIAAEHPDWEAKVKALSQITKEQLQRWVDIEILSKDAQQRVLAAHPNYIPLPRNLDGKSESLDAFVSRLNSGILDISDPIKKFHGSDRTLESPVEKIAENQYLLETMAARQKVVNTIQDGILNGRYDPELIKEAGNATDPGLGKEFITFYRNGEKQRYIVDSQTARILEAFSAHQKDADLLSKVAGFMSTVLREGATRTPSFAIPNMVRDTFEAAIINKGVMPIVDTYRGFMHVINEDAVYKDFLEHGGDQGMTWGSKEQRKKNVSDLYKQEPTKKLSKDGVLKLWDFLGRLSDVSEAATRCGTYAKLVKMGMDPNEAAFKTIDTMWFSRGGVTSKKWNRYVPFFNASLQGTYSLGKNLFKGGKLNKGMATKALLSLALPSMLLTMWNLGDDDRKDAYLQIDRNQRNNYWNIVLNKNDIVKIPKPHAMGMLFSSLGERMMEYTYANDKRAYDHFVSSLMDSLSPDTIPGIFKLPFEWILNKSLYTGRDIVPVSEQKYAPRDQFGPYTSDTAKWLADAVYKGSSPFLNAIGKDGFEMSPRKIEYAVNSLLGTLGREAMKVNDVGLRAINGRELPSRSILADMPVTNRFYSEGGRQSNTENDFRKALDDALEQVHSLSSKAKTASKGDMTPYERKYYGAKAAIQGLQTKELRAITQLESEKKQIADNPRMDGDRKRKLIDMREKKIVQISKEGLARLDRILNR